MKRLLVGILLSFTVVQPGHAQEAGAKAQAPVAAQNAAPPKAAAPKTEVKKEKPVSLEATYKREFAFLQAQKKELEKRLKTFKSQADSAEKTIKRKIDSLENLNIELSAKDDTLRTSLANAERKDDALSDNNELLEMTYSQGNASLDAYGRSLESNADFVAGNDDVKLAMMFREAADLLKDLGSIRTREERFFMADGAEISGTVVNVGNIAAYGVSDKASGILVPAGGARLKLWPEPAEDVAKGILAGKAPDDLKIFLFESRDKAVDEKQEKTVFSIIESGGTIGWAIVGLGVIVLILIGIRGVLLYLASLNTQSIADEVIPLLQQDKESEALAYCRQQKGPFARVLMATIQNSHGNRDHMDDVISEALLHESGTLNRFGSAILVIASISPLLGLLGTVTGMISTFDIITEFGTGDPKMLSSGISVALVTTELGLIVAIPAVLAGTLLSSWSDGIKYDLEEVALKATNILLDHENPEKIHKKAKAEASKISAVISHEPDLAVS